MFRKKPLIILSFVILISSFFYVFISAKLFDSDFWWHISTGRYIVETGSIPDKDPFSYTSNLVENRNLFQERENFILKQYWLGQVIFYLIYDYTGPAGIIVLRASLLTMVILLVLWRLRRWDVNFYISFIYIFLVYLDILRYTGERPVLFTILLTPLTFIILEEFKEKRGKIVFLLPLLMLLWSNLHGGFIIGNIIIAVYMLVEGFKIIIKKASFSRHEIIIFYTLTSLALLTSYINPTGWDAFLIALSSKYKFLEASIQEYQSPFFLYINKLSPINYGFVTLAFIFPLILILRNKKIDLTHVILLTGFFIMAAKTGRYTIYYVSIAAMVLGRETDILLKHLLKERIPDRIYTKIVFAFSILALLSSILFFIGVFKFQWLRLDIAKRSYVPVSSVDFIEQNRLPGNILNSHPYGGYVTWRLYPWKMTFIDTRWLNPTVQREYGWIMNAIESVSVKKLHQGKLPLWKRLLNHYDINFILCDTLDVYGNVPKLLLTLAEDKEWVPVYCEPIAIIFIKNIPKNQDIIKKFYRPKEEVYNTIIGIASQIAIYDRLNPSYLVTLGKTFYEMGRLKDALIAYQYALRRVPNDSVAKEKITQIESELKQDKSNERD
ncbi:MAG: hypothetical protein A2027_00370 [Thermodesulfovibrio sp. RBG_19FT_COMBO_41_18]|nr:MAG: hypothetical protein A2027_00370 [Thermodesulfovibrio sp. RBG_19FT_COMBO_41_18]